MTLQVIKQFPFAQTIEQIVAKLAERNWVFPGIKTTFWDNGAGLMTLCGDDWGILFYSYHDKPMWIAQVAIKGMEIAVFDDESGPAFYYYVGKNWERDKEKFILTTKIHSRMDNKPYLPTL
jgi:hypothetical protein